MLVLHRQYPSFPAPKCLRSNLHTGQQMDTDRQTGAPGNDDAALPSMIDVRAWHMNCFQTFVSSSATGFQKNCN